MAALPPRPIVVVFLSGQSEEPAVHVCVTHGSGVGNINFKNVEIAIEQQSGSYLQVVNSGCQMRQEFSSCDV